MGGVVYGINDEGKPEALKINSSGNLDISLTDQTTPVLIIPMNRTTNSTTITANTAIGDRTVTVADTTGFVAGAHVTLTNVSGLRYYIGHQVGAVSGNDVTLDTPLDFAYQSGDIISAGSHDMSVNGAVTPVTFGVRSAEPSPPNNINLTIDITRIIITCTTATAVDLNKFGDITPILTNGLVIRKRDGSYNNIVNFKSNADIANTAYDFTVYQASNPVQGIDGFVSRLTFAGQNKIGVAVRIETGEDLEAIVQDDLSTLTSLSIMAEGHVVLP